LRKKPLSVVLPEYSYRRTAVFGIHNIASRQNHFTHCTPEFERVAQSGRTAADGYSDSRNTMPGIALVPRGKRKQGDVPGLLDGAGKAALVRSADAGEPPRHNFAALGYKALQ